MIDWNALLLVAAVAIGAATSVSLAFALGIRFLTNAKHIQENTKKKEGTKPLEILNRVAAYAMFTIASSAILYGIYLIVPYFHLDK
ncbi:MAG: hypothetical protein RLZZ258_370 [Actinomycetota bacterium]|jgi:cadmium resistance protein CadD (predicted permease)